METKTGKQEAKCEVWTKVSLSFSSSCSSMWSSRNKVQWHQHFRCKGRQKQKVCKKGIISSLKTPDLAKYNLGPQQLNQWKCHPTVASAAGWGPDASVTWPNRINALNMKHWLCARFVWNRKINITGILLSKSLLSKREEKAEYKVRQNVICFQRGKNKALWKHCAMPANELLANILCIWATVKRLRKGKGSMMGNGWWVLGGFCDKEVISWLQKQLLLISYLWSLRLLFIICIPNFGEVPLPTQKSVLVNDQSLFFSLG